MLLPTASALESYYAPFLVSGRSIKCERLSVGWLVGWFFIYFFFLTNFCRKEMLICFLLSLAKFPYRKEMLVLLQVHTKKRNAYLLIGFYAPGLGFPLTLIRSLSTPTQGIFILHTTIGSGIQHPAFRNAVGLPCFHWHSSSVAKKCLSVFHCQSSRVEKKCLSVSCFRAQVLV